MTNETNANLGGGSMQYEALGEWEQLPDGITLVETPGVAVGADDTVYLMTRNTEHPVMVLRPDGSWIRSFGAGHFSDRTHGIWIAPDSTLYCADDGTHTITLWSPEGDLLQTIGEANAPAPRWSGQPFNRPTHCAVSPLSGDLFITDGYGNSCIHRFSPKGEHKATWGEPGIDEGQFIRPHNIAIDENGLLYVADRECHRVQIFREDGTFVTMWNNIHRPDGLTLGADGLIYIGELNGIAGVDDAPGLGHRVSVYSRNGKRVALFGDEEEGEGPGEFIAPHGIAVDSRGDIYIGEVANTIRGRQLDPPRELKTLKKLRRTS